MPHCSGGMEVPTSGLPGSPPDFNLIGARIWMEEKVGLIGSVTREVSLASFFHWGAEQTTAASS